MMEDPVNIPSERSSPSSPRRASTLSAMSAWELAEHCQQAMSHYRCGDPSSDQYAIELFRRATRHGDQEAWAGVRHCFSESVRGWLHRHPNKEAACRLDNEEHYVALTFARCWQATTSQQVEFDQLSAVLRYLQVCLNGVILDALRVYSRLKVVSLQEPVEPGKPLGEDSPDSDEIWGLLKAMLPNEREQRLAYLLFHCGLSPSEILTYAPQEFCDVHEICRLRRNILRCQGAGG
jgi:hypothetical protein